MTAGVDALDRPAVVAMLGGLHSQILELRAELAAIDAAIARRQADAILLAETPAADASLALVQRCLDDMVRSVRAEVRSSVEEPAEWAAAERLRLARHRVEATDPSGAVGSPAEFDAFWQEQIDAVEARSEALTRLAPIGAVLPVVALVVGALSLLHLL